MVSINPQNILLIEEVVTWIELKKERGGMGVDYRSNYRLSTRL